MPDGWNHFRLEIDPVPASRPRVPRYGRVYYGKGYTAFRKEAAEALSKLTWPPSYPLHGALHMRVEFHVRRPKKTELAAPRGDVDNYLKSLLDMLQGERLEGGGGAFLDDRQVVNIQASKHWAERGSIEVWLAEVGRFKGRG